MQVLDNPVWHALRGPHAHLAEHEGLARRYQPDVTPFAALPDDADAGAWADLARLVAGGGMVAIFRDRVDPPDGWQELMRFPTLQLVWPDRSPPPPALTPEPLTVDDLDQMLDLVARTVPGPFLPRTIELGGYVGLRDGGRLVAMAGERFNTGEHAEISAVCTDAEHRGRGLAAALVHHLIGSIRSRGEVPFLHVVDDNVGAIALYERLGFTRRRHVEVKVLQPPTS